MSQKTRSIKVIIHAPEDEASLQLFQEATNDLYCKIITDELARTDLTCDEKRSVLDQLAAILDSQ